jgi:hypothetical protein
MAKRTGDFSIFELAKVGIQNERKIICLKKKRSVLNRKLFIS